MHGREKKTPTHDAVLFTNFNPVFAEPSALQLQGALFWAPRKW